MKFDVLIPAFNESKNLYRIESDLIPQLHRDHIDFELIIVDDGSSDDTGSVAEEVANRRADVRVIHHQENMGLGAALRTGYSHARNPWVITIDSDLSYSPDQVLNLVEKAGDDVDAVFGSPYMRGGRVEGVSQIRVIPSKGISILYSLFMRKRLSCWTGMFRAIRRKAVQSIQITQNGFDGVAEIAVKLVRSGNRVVEVPAVLGRRTEGVSKASFSREFMKHLIQLRRVVTQTI
ncbi:MAG: glycosyltransferase [Candidatus Thorarchaeota archaeon]|jgi:dolichol-phosphate mannosyltransferase